MFEIAPPTNVPNNARSIRLCTHPAVISGSSLFPLQALQALQALQTLQGPPLQKPHPPGFPKNNLTHISNRHQESRYPHPTSNHHSHPFLVITLPPSSPYPPPLVPSPQFSNNNLPNTNSSHTHPPFLSSAIQQHNPLHIKNPPQTKTKTNPKPI